MIKKILISILCLLLLSGCIKDTDFNSAIESIIEKATSVYIAPSSSNNCEKRYYTYNDLMNICRIDSDEVYNVFCIDGNYCALNLDITSIISYKIYSDANENLLQSSVTFENPLFSKKGVYYNSSDETIPYSISISENDEANYCIFIQTSEFQFISIVKKEECANILYDMIILLRTIKVDRTLVYTDYSDKSILSEDSKVISLFNIISQSGYLIDTIEKKDNDSGFIIIDNSERESVLDEQVEGDEPSPTGGNDDEVD